MRTLWIEPFGGAAGDMLLAALLDLEDPRFDLGSLQGLADELVPGECRVELEEVRRGGAFRAKLVRVRTNGDAPAHRHLAALLAILENASLPARARSRAEAVLRRLARAEARVHGTSVEEVHFHEVGAVDTLVDVCGVALAVELLGIEDVRASPPYAGAGSVVCEHGEMPVPAPGTAELLRGIPWRSGPGGERLTPTGAALLAELARSFELPGVFVPEGIGYGAGERDPEDGPPNLLRVQVGDAGAGERVSEVVELCCNLDDATGEEIGFLLEGLRASGALDVWCVSGQMKKGRPGVIVHALAREGDRQRLVEVLLGRSPTLGVRWSRMQRFECEREEVLVRLGGEPVRVKRRIRSGPPRAADLSPEHDDLARLAGTTGRPLRELERAAVEAALELLSG